MPEHLSPTLTLRDGAYRIAKRQIAKTRTAANKAKTTYQRSDTFASYYSNDTQVQTGLFDVRLMFGTIDVINKERGEVEVIQNAEVRMSLPHARLVHGILSKHLEDYEKKFGKVPEIQTA